MDHISTPCTEEVVEIIVESAEAAGHDVGVVVAFLAAYGLGYLANVIGSAPLRNLAMEWYLQVCQENALQPRGIRTGIHVAVPLIK